LGPFTPIKLATSLSYAKTLRTVLKKDLQSSDISGLFDGCRLNREIKEKVEKAGFSKVETVNCGFAMQPWFFLYLNPVKFALYGWATK
jgi:hypothetical protein